MNKPIVGSPAEKPSCHVRRHLTPSEFMTYDAMRSMAKPDGLGNLICYAQLITITNRTSIGKNQNGDNIKALVEKGWVIPMNKVRRRAGRWANNQYIVLDHDKYERRAFAHEDPYVMCPAFKFNEQTGENLRPMTDAEREDFEHSEFAINAALKKWAQRPEQRKLAAALQAIMDAATPVEKAEWFRKANGDPVTFTLPIKQEEK